MCERGCGRMGKSRAQHENPNTSTVNTMRSSHLLALLFGTLACASMALATSHMVGGSTHASPQDPDTQKAARFALTSLNEGNQVRDNFGNALAGHLTLVAIKDVTTQVVAGVNYNLVLSVRDEAGHTQDISVTVWARPWLEKRNDPTDPAWQLTKAHVLNNEF